MLAWVHQATASEHEFLEGLLGVKEKRRMVGAERSVHEGEEEEIVHDALDKDLEGLSRPLKVCCDCSTSLKLDLLTYLLKMRIQQTIKSQEGIIMAYKIANLLQFYLVTMRKTIGNQALLSKTLQECVAAFMAIQINRV